MILLGMLFSACSNGSVLHAPNGKKYYVDVDNCDRYTLDRDRLFCYDSKKPDFKKSYMPIEFGQSIDTRQSF